MAAVTKVAVWDHAVRLMHWTLVLAVAASWITTLAFGKLHQPAGYLALAVVLLRCAWGFAGGRYARFAQFVRGPGATFAYLRLVLRGRAPRHLGHNPLGGWMIVALLACVGGLGLSGWLYTTDAFWGDETVDIVHQTLAWAVLVLATLHVAGVVFTGRHARENLVLAMFDGRKAAPGPDDVA